MDLRTQLLVTSALCSSDGELRGSFIVVNYPFYQERDPEFRTAFSPTSYVFNQTFDPNFYTSASITQYVQKAPEYFMAEKVFPELKGLTWNCHLKPQFSTKIAQHTSGKETRTAYWEFPRYDFEISYDYLPNRKEVGVTDLERLLGFFLERGGAYEEFLFKMTDFSKVENKTLLIGNGITTEVVLTARVHNYQQPIGQVDPANSQIFFNAPGGTFTLPELPNIYVTIPNIPVATLTQVTVDGDVLVASGAPNPAPGFYFYNSGLNRIYVNGDYAGMELIADLTIPTADPTVGNFPAADTVGDPTAQPYIPLPAAEPATFNSFEDSSDDFTQVFVNPPVNPYEYFYDETTGRAILPQYPLYHYALVYSIGMTYNVPRTLPSLPVAVSVTLSGTNITVNDVVLPGGTASESLVYPPPPGTYFFNSETGDLFVDDSYAGDQINVSFQYQGIYEYDYSFLMPNTLVLSQAPPVGTIVTGTYEYWFIVRFADDMADFDTFADKLWEMQELTLRSVIV